MIKTDNSLSQMTKKRVYTITTSSVLCFLMIWQFFWSDNNHLRFNPYIFWPMMALASFVAIALLQKTKTSKYTMLVVFSLVWCSASSFINSTWTTGVVFILEILLYFIAVKLFANQGIEFTRIAYGFCIAHMVLLLAQVLIPSFFYFLVEFISGTSKVVLLRENANNGVFYGFTGQTSTIAFYLIFGLIISLYYFTKGKSLNYLFLLLGILFEVSLLLTNRRGGTLLSLAIIIIFIILDRRRLTFKIGLITALVAVVLIIGLDRIPGFKGIVTKFQLTSERNNLFSGRTLFWDYCIETFKQKPLFGSGFGSFSQSSRFQVETAHNSYVQKLAELGIVGTIFFFAPHVYSLFVSLKMFLAKDEKIDAKKYMIFAILLQLAFFFFAIFEGVFETPILYVFIFLIEHTVVDKYRDFKKKRSFYENRHSYCR